MSPETLLILKNFSSINKSIRFNQGNKIFIANVLTQVLACAEVDFEFPKTFSINDLGQLLSTLSLFPDPTIEFEDRQLTIRSNQKTIKYRYCTPSITSDQPSALPNIGEPSFTFDLSRDQLAELLKACSILGLKEIEISSNSIRALNSAKDGSAIDNEYGTSVENVNIISDSNFKVTLCTESIKVLPLDYKVLVNKIAVRFVSLDGKLTYLIASVSNS